MGSTKQSELSASVSSRAVGPFAAGFANTGVTQMLAVAAHQQSQPHTAKRKAPTQPAATKRSRKDAGPQGAPTLKPHEALAMAGGDHAMAFGAMVGHAHAAMVPPGRRNVIRQQHGPRLRLQLGQRHWQLEDGERIADGAECITKEGRGSSEAQKDDTRPGAVVQYHEQHPKGIDALRFGWQYMSRDDFRKILARDGLIETQPGAKHEGQHVYHIIATSNGGPDHTDNYLYALGGSFNIAVGDRFDHLNCFLAGKAKAEKAVAIAIKVANDPSLHMHIEKRGKAKQVTTFRDGPHASIQSGGQLYKMGQDLFRDMRAAAR